MIQVGDKIIKVGGNFQHTGTAVAVFKTLTGKDRVVIEFDAPVQGMLHVYTLEQVEKLQNDFSK